MANILLLDPARLYDHLLLALFRFEGHHLHAAPDAEAAARGLGTGLFDLFVVNLEAPREAVVPALEHRRAHLRAVPTVGINTGAFRACYQDFTFAGVFETPLDLAQVRRQAARALRTLAHELAGPDVYKVAARRDLTLRLEGGAFPGRTVHFGLRGVTVEGLPKAVDGGLFDRLEAQGGERPVIIELRGAARAEAALALPARLCGLLRHRDPRQTLAAFDVDDQTLAAHQELWGEYFPHRAAPPAPAPTSASRDAA